MTEGKVFLDTNILVYAHDTSAGTKHDLARGIVAQQWTRRRGVLSTQVLQEFFVSVTRRLPKPMDTATAQKVVADLLNWEVIVNDGNSILGAVELLKRYKYSFWDSLIVHAALQAGAEVLLSEALSTRKNIQGMTIENPFSE
jgi:predicted nucleic acid-binding protein